MESVLNGRLESKPEVVKPARKSKSKPRERSTNYLRQVAKWGTRYVITACVLSSALNAWANVDCCQSENYAVMGAAAILGAVIPGLVWMLFHIAGNLYRAGRLRIAACVGAAGIALLALSIWHCAHAIALLTGGGIILSALLAIGVDVGLVVSEVAATLASENQAA